MARRLIGRTPGFDPGNAGSSPAAPAISRFLESLDFWSVVREGSPPEPGKPMVVEFTDGEVYEIEPEKKRK